MIGFFKKVLGIICIFFGVILLLAVTKNSLDLVKTQRFKGLDAQDIAFLIGAFITDGLFVFIGFWLMVFGAKKLRNKKMPVSRQ
jgi:hypothetical protein